MKIVKNFLVFFISIIITIIIIEIFLRIFYPQTLTGTWRIQDENGLWLNKNNGSSVHQFIYDNKKISVKYNFGKFNNRIYKSQIQKNDREKILILGDSFTFGWLLKDEETFVFNLQEKYKNFYFVNAASGGWGTADYLRYIQSYCLKIKPKKIFIFINQADYQRSLNSNLYKIENQKLIEKKNQISNLKKNLDTIDKFYSFVIERFHFIQIIRKLYNSFITDLRIDNANLTEKNYENLNLENLFLIQQLYKKIKFESYKCKSDLNIVNLAWPIEFVSKSILSFNRKIETFIKDINIKFYTLENEMKLIFENSKDYSIPKDIHPNKKGSDYIFSSIIAQKIFEKL